MNGKYTLKHIGVGSAFKMGAAVGGILSAIILVPLGLLTAIGVVGSDDTSLMAAGATMGLLTMFCGPVVYALIYGLSAALSALTYNAVAKLAGGVEFRLEPVRPRPPRVVVNERPYPDVEDAPPAGEGEGTSSPSVNDVW